MRRFGLAEGRPAPTSNLRTPGLCGGLFALGIGPGGTGPFVLALPCLERGR